MVSRYFKNPIVTVIAGCLFSGTIEIMQYITGRGLTEVDDVITNTIGAVVGVLMYSITRLMIDRLTLGSETFKAF